MLLLHVDVLGSEDCCLELFEGQSSQKRLDILLKELNSMGFKQKDFFTGLVRSPACKITSFVLYYIFRTNF